MLSIRFFACPKYRTALASTVVGTAGVWGAWQVLHPIHMNQHFTLSWDGILKDRQVWTIWTSHFSHCSGEHLLGNVGVFSVLGFALQKVLSLNWLGAHLFFTPIVASSATLASLYYCHGPLEAKALCKEYPSLEWNLFCHYRFLELRNGLQNALTPAYCGFEELGIPAEVTVPECGYAMPDLVARFKPYEKWYHESVRGTLGMSAIALSLQGFGAAWLMHLCAHGLANYTVGIGLSVLLLQPLLDLYTLSQDGRTSPSNALRVGDYRRTDVVGHLAGFGNGVLLYMLRSRGLGMLVKPRFAGI
jgi:membrane associated rhomboid family serine protease